MWRCVIGCVVLDVWKDLVFETSGITHPTTQSYIPEDLNPHWQNLKPLFLFLPLARSHTLSRCACISICPSACSHLHSHFLSVSHSFLPPLVAVETLFRPSEPYLLSPFLAYCPRSWDCYRHTQGVGVRACSDFSKMFVPRGQNPVVSTCAFYSWLRSHAQFAFRYCYVLV